MDKVICAIIAIMVIECIALLQGIDGALMMSSIALIAGLGGYELRKHREKVINFVISEED